MAWVCGNVRRILDTRGADQKEARLDTVTPYWTGLSLAVPVNISKIECRGRSEGDCDSIPCAAPDEGGADWEGALPEWGYVGQPSCCTTR